MLHQHFHDGGMLLLDRPHQSRGSANVFLGVDVGLVVQKHFHRVQVAGARGHHERRIAHGSNLVGIRAGLQQFVDHRGGPAFAGKKERRRAIAIGRFDVRARGDEHVRHGRIVVVNGPLQGSCTVGLGRVHVGPLS